LGSNFNNDMTDDPFRIAAPPSRESLDDRPASPGGPALAAPVPSPTAVASPQSAPVSDAVIKFRSCRWRRPPDEGTECCGHRDVLPIAGTTSFDAEAWCPDCQYFKLRRTPKKREEPYRY
jgi:hypothetical protein